MSFNCKPTCEICGKHRVSGIDHTACSKLLQERGNSRKPRKREKTLKGKKNSINYFAKL